MNNIQTSEQYGPFIFFLASMCAGIAINKWQKIRNLDNLDNSSITSSHKDILKNAYLRFEREMDVNHLIPHVTEFAHQVAGHTKEVLVKYQDKVLKPMIKKDLFLKEVLYYEEFAKASEVQANIVSPITYLPKYYGACTYKRILSSSSESFDELEYLVLDDMTSNFRHPCAMDVKMGTQTFEPSATTAKKERELKKYVWQEEMGFRITGYKKYDVTTNKYDYREKTYGRSLHPTEVENAVEGFFNNGLLTRVDVIQVVIEKLEKLLRWFLIQRQYHFFCSSILICYDGAVVDEIWESSNNVDVSQRVGWSSKAVSPEDLVEVKMIDLAHTIRCGNEEGQEDVDLDHGYIHGLRVLLHMLENLVNARARDGRLTESYKGRVGSLHGQSF